MTNPPPLRAPPAAFAWGAFFARWVLGLMFFQGALWRVFELGPVAHARQFFVEPYAETLLPTWSLWVTGMAVPWVELGAGALLLIGLWVRPALVVLGFELLIVTFGHLLLEPLYSISGHIFPRLVLLVLLLLIPAEADRWTVDAWRAGRSSSPEHAGPG